MCEPAGRQHYPPSLLLVMAAQECVKSKIEMQTNRLLLRNVRFEDSEQLVKYANDLAIAEMMNGSIPYPYTQEVAEQWIFNHQADTSTTQAISWAIALKEGDRLVGSVQLRRQNDKKSARLSYWVGRLYWNQGLATEATRCVIKYGFEELHLEFIEAEVFKRNAASQALLCKLGFNYQATVCKQEGFAKRMEDFDYYLLTKQAYFHS